MSRVDVALFMALLAFWFVLSEQTGPIFVTMGVVSAVAVTAMTHAFFRQAFNPVRQPLRYLPLRLWRIATFSVWLFGRALVSSVEVARMVVHPRLPAEPGFMTFSTGLRSPVARVTLANAITLVPGTLTVRVSGDEFMVHALWPGAADDLRSAAMQRRIARMFFEEPDEPPTTVWEPAGDRP